MNNLKEESVFLSYTIWQGDQGSPEWVKLRQGHIGSSDIAVIVGKSPFATTVHDLWLEKRGNKEIDPPSYPMIRGKELEPIARESYIAETGNIVGPEVFVCSEKPYMASLDGITLDRRIILEAKAPMSIETLFKVNSENIREFYYYIQVQWQLMIVGAAEADLYLYHPDAKPLLIKILPDTTFQAFLRIEADKFWYMVENNIEPEKIEDAKIKIDDPMCIVAADKIKIISEKKELLVKEEKEAKEVFKSYGDGGAFECNGVEAIWTDGRKTLDVNILKKKYNLSDAMLNECMKQGEGFYTVRITKC
jgi:putative phage-type endonuclease